MKQFEETLALKDKEEAEMAFAQVQKKLDKAASKRLIHKNAAKRHKARLAKKLHQVQ